MGIGFWHISSNIENVANNHIDCGNATHRGVAQPDSAFGLGPKGRGFESRRPDINRSIPYYIQALQRVWCNGSTRPFQGLSIGSSPFTRYLSQPSGPIAQRQSTRLIML